MLLSLQKLIQKELCPSVSLTYRIDQIEDHTDEMERQLAEQTKVYNDRVDRQAQVLRAFQTKLADLEDSSHCNNIKFGGIPESTKPADMTTF